MKQSQRNILFKMRRAKSDTVMVNTCIPQEELNDYNDLCRHGYLTLINHEDVFQGDADMCIYQGGALFYRFTQMSSHAYNECTPGPKPRLEDQLFMDELATLFEKYDASIVPIGSHTHTFFIQHKGRMIPLDYRNSRFGASAFRKCAKAIKNCLNFKTGE